MSADAAADGDERVAPEGDPRQVELEATVEQLWATLEQLREQRGSPSFRSVARRARLPTSTVADWFKKRTVVPDWPEFAALVTALDADPQAVHQSWTRARTAYDELRRLHAQRPRTRKLLTPAPPLPPGDDEDGGDEDHGRGVGNPAVIRVLGKAWARLGRSRPQRISVATAVVGALIAGAIVVPTLWASPNEPAPLPLYRYQAPTSDSANFISPTEPGPQGWIPMSSIGGVYAAREEGVLGLVPIYRYRCTSCASLVYFLSKDGGPKPNFVLEAEAFRCFDPNRPPPPNTRALQALWNSRTKARTWVVRGTPEYAAATANGFKDPSPGGEPLCYIW